MPVVVVGLAVPMGTATALVQAAVPSALGMIATTGERGSWISLAITVVAQGASVVLRGPLAVTQGALAEMDANLFQDNHALPLTKEFAKQFPSKVAEVYQRKIVQQQQDNNVGLFQSNNVNLSQDK